MNAQEEQRRILQLIDDYVSAFEQADADMMESLFWIDDSRFCEVENDRRNPFGRETLLAIGDWMRKNAQPGGKMRFYETRLHILAPDVAYSVSMRDEYEGETAIPSRVTLIFLKKGDTWKIIHGHFSHVPQ